MSNHLDRPTRRDRRKNFRLGWHLPATIYDVGRHLERPCTLVDISNGGAKIAGVRAHTMSSDCAHPSVTVNHARLSGAPRMLLGLNSLSKAMTRRVHPINPQCGADKRLSPTIPRFRVTAAFVLHHALDGGFAHAGPGSQFLDRPPEISPSHSQLSASDRTATVVRLRPSSLLRHATRITVDGP